MIDLGMYKNSLLSKGNNISQVRKNYSDDIMNATFTDDIGYKRVYILTNDGWKYEDAKYQTHTAQSILKDSVDYYLQFRPKVHYPIGSYVIIPDDTSFDVNTTENPFDQDVSERTQWWLIVGRDEAGQFVRYNILKCNWNFQWIYNNKIQNCFGCVRNANSYTSGKWTDEYSSSLDNLQAAWIPDIYNTYSNYEKLKLDDTRTIDYEQRFIISDNIYHPKVYQVTKVVELVPRGIIKLSLKQDDFNEKRDNADLMICDYYNDNGDLLINIDKLNKPDITKTSRIDLMYINDDEELDCKEENITNSIINIGIASYFKVVFSDINISPKWDIKIIDENDELSEEEKQYYENLIKITKLDNYSISIKPSKAGSLVEKKFKLNVSDSYGEYLSSIELEVGKW